MARMYRKIIRIPAEASPNVRLGLLQRAKGEEPTHEVLTPGVLTLAEYDKREATWDEIRKCIGLRAMFYEGAEVLLYPPDWLDRANRIADNLRLRGRVRQAKGIGCDPGEGGADSAWSVVDEYGLIFLIALKTPDTTVVSRITVDLIEKFKVDPTKVCLDRGGGGKQHADYLRARGYKVRTVAFGESLVLEPKRSKRLFGERVENREERYTYVNRRAQMFGELRALMDPSREMLEGPGAGFGIPQEYDELRRQLAPIPLLYDPEGRMKMLPKNKKDPESDERTLTEIIGCSPDQADSLVLAVHAMLHKGTKTTAGAIS